jgi:cytochrome c oxidase subunit 4
MNQNQAHKEHILPRKTYLLVAVALLTLTAITVKVSFIRLGGFNAIAAIGIATLKALLVSFFFMHLLYDRKIHLFIFSMGLLFVGVFIALTMFDTLRRADIYDVTAEPIKKNAVIYQQIPADTTQVNEGAGHH